MKLSLETITSFQQVYEQINDRSIDEKKARIEILDLYENLVLSVIQRIPVSDKQHYHQLLEGVE